jgi:hemerythrin-like domain-containing protein
MQSRGLLMIEHRLIERMIFQVKIALGRIPREGGVDPRFIDIVVDFVRTYADRTHHGKEEDLLFGALASRPLSDHAAVSWAS